MTRNVAMIRLVFATSVLVSCNICAIQGLPTAAPTIGRSFGSAPSGAFDGSPASPSAHLCSEYFYETDIKMSSADNLPCTPENIIAIGKLIDKAYDEVIALDNAISDINITLQTTVCPQDSSTSTQRRYLQQERTRKLAPVKPTRKPTRKPTKRPTARKISAAVSASWTGGGLCNLCSKDNYDRRLSPGGEDDEHRTLFRQEAYEVIDFSVNGAGSALSPNTYVKRNWRGSYGLVVDAIPFRGRYAPSEMARIFDSANPGSGSILLGSPNVNCAGGGPGFGAGGAPGEEGENCVPQGNVVIIQDNSTTVAKANPDGGILVFSFDSATRIGHIGLMNIFNGTASIEIITHDDQNITIPVGGLGANSVQQVHIGYALFTLRVILHGPGAVTEIGVFAPATAVEALSYRSGQSYASDISLFDEYLPYLEFDISYYLTRKVNDVFGAASGGCLTDAWAQIDVALEKVKGLPIAAELKCGAIQDNIWTECPTDFVDKILEHKCTAGLECLFDTSTTAAECNCGSDQQFYCSDLATGA